MSRTVSSGFVEGTMSVKVADDRCVVDPNLFNKVLQPMSPGPGRCLKRTFGCVANHREHEDYSKGIDPETLVGRAVVFVRDDLVCLDDGRCVQVALDGDCCSSSYLTPEGLQELRELRGSTILSVEFCDGSSKAGRPNIERDRSGYDDATSWHFLVFRTDKGTKTVDWRNDSNGYYDGNAWLELVVGLTPVAHDAACEGLPDEKVLELAKLEGWEHAK